MKKIYCPNCGYEIPRRFLEKVEQVTVDAVKGVTKEVAKEGLKEVVKRIGNNEKGD